MSLPESNVPSTAAAPASATPVTDLVVSLRPILAYLCLAIGLAGFLFGGYQAAKILRSIQAEKAQQQDAQKPADQKPEADPLKSAAEAVGPLSKPENVLGALGGFMFAVIFGGVGISQLLGLPALTLPEQQKEARRSMLILGGLTGLVILTLGLSFFILYFGTLVTWLGQRDQPPPADTWKVLTAILAMVLGAGLGFLAALPARTDERNQPGTRRLIYGINFGLSTLLLIMLLLVVNILVALKVPNKLDTTAAGINSIELSPATVEYLQGLTVPVTIYSTIEADTGEDLARSVAQDSRRLLEAIRAQNPTQITIKTLSKILNREQINELRTKFPQADLSDDGLLLVVGPEEKLSSYVRFQDLVDLGAGNRMGGESEVSFVGEQKLMKELLFLSQDKKKPVLYVTTGHGELEVLSGFDPNSPPPPPGRTATQLRLALEKSNFELRSLAFDLTDPKVPADCSVLILPDPRSPFNEKELAALRDYLEKPNAEGKTGRMILLSSPSLTPDKNSVVDLRLDEVLGAYGISLDNRFVLNQPNQSLSYNDALGVVVPAQRGENPISKEFTVDTPLILPNARMINIAPSSQGKYQTERLILSYPGRISWLENVPPDSPSRALKELLENPELQTRKQAINRSSRPLGAIVSEGDRGKLVVFGSGAAFADPYRGGPLSDPEQSARLITVTVNYLREQPEVANIVAKKYGTFSMTKEADLLRMVALPFLVFSFTAVALGVGIWVVRRK